MTQTDDIQYIATDAELAAFCRALADADFIAVDTEFTREKTYYAKLCLIQIAGRERIACIDPFTVKDFMPLLDVFDNEAITKVMHSSHQDMEVFFQNFDCLPRPVYDTQIAASLLGMGEQAAYAKVVQAMLGVKLDKSHTRTDWMRRPLDEAQIKYAADDVRYLARLYPLQNEKLQSLGRLEWLAGDFAALSTPARYQPDPGNAWTRVKGHMRLSGADLSILQLLAQYREHKAIAYNRPRRFVLKDEQLLEIVKIKPKSMPDLERWRGFTKAIKRHGPALIECAQKGLQTPPTQWPDVVKRKPLTDTQEVYADALMLLLKLQAKRHQISATALAGRRDIESLARGERDGPLLSGWRHELAGKPLLDFIDGKTALRADSMDLRLAPRDG